jgi:hypothetical protein
MNEIYRAHSEGRSFDEVSKKLIDHKIIHQRLPQKFIEHEKNILRDQQLSAPFFEFLKSLLVTHNRGIGSKYAGRNLDVKAA